MRKRVEASTRISKDDPDLVWGAKAIGIVLGRSEHQVHYLHEKGLLHDALFKLSHKMLVLSRRKLRELPETIAKNS